MGGTQSADDSDSESDLGEDESKSLRDEDNEELEQEPEVRPFKHPQSPLMPQDSDITPPLIEPLKLSESSPLLEDGGERTTFTLNVRNSEPGSSPSKSFQSFPESPSSPDGKRSLLSTMAQHISQSEEVSVSSEKEDDPTISSTSRQTEDVYLSEEPEEEPLPVSDLSLESSVPSLAFTPLESGPLSDVLSTTGTPVSTAPVHEVTTEFYVIRHGEATNNLSTAIGGRSPSASLTSKGRHQATLLGSFLREYRGINFDSIYSSPLERAKATALLVCQELGVSEEAIQLEKDLQELSQGEWEGRERSDLYTLEMVSHMNSTQPDFHAPGGESQRQVEFRMVEFLNRIVTGSLVKEPSLSSMKVSNGKNRLEDILSGALEYPSQQNTERSRGVESTVVDHNKTNGSRTGNKFESKGKVVRVALFSHGTAIKCMLRGILGSDSQMTYKLIIDNTSVTVLKHTSNKGWYLVGMNDTSHLVIREQTAVNGLLENRRENV